MILYFGRSASLHAVSIPVLDTRRPNSEPISRFWTSTTFIGGVTGAVVFCQQVFVLRGTAWVPTALSYSTSVCLFSHSGPLLRATVFRTPVDLDEFGSCEPASALSSCLGSAGLFLFIFWHFFCPPQMLWRAIFLLTIFSL